MTALDPGPANDVLADVVERVLGDLATKPLLTVNEVAGLLGQGRTATFDAIRRGELPSVRWGRRVLVPTPALAAWLLGQDPPGNEDDPAVSSSGAVVALAGRGIDPGTRHER